MIVESVCLTCKSFVWCLWRYIDCICDKVELSCSAVKPHYKIGKRIDKYGEQGIIQPQQQITWINITYWNY